MSLRTFARCRPSNVKLLADTPDSECLCDKCTNVNLLKVELLKCKIVGIEKHTSDAIRETMCKVEATDVEVNQDFGYIQCIRRECDRCGTEAYFEKIVALNPGLKEDKEIVYWKKWDLVNTGKGKKMDIVEKRGKKYDLLLQYKKDLQHLLKDLKKYLMMLPQQ